MMIEEIDSDGSGTVDFDGKYLRAALVSPLVQKCLFFFTEFMEVMTGE